MKAAFCSRCPAEADLAISTTGPPGKGLRHTIWQYPEDAPRTAIRYCILHGVGTAAGLAAMSATGETTYSVELTNEGRVARAEQGIKDKTDEEEGENDG